MWGTTKQLWRTLNKVITESGFCVLKGLVYIYDRVVYGSSLVKNCIYWPTGIYVDQINAH